MRPGHVPGVVALQEACFPDPFPADQRWQEWHLLAHLGRCPEFQLVALEGGQVVGSASSLVVSEAAWQAHLPWEEATGGWEFAAHDPAGTTLYGADISVHPEWRGRGVGWALYQARFALVRSLGLARFGTCCRLPGLRASGLGPEEYARSVAEGFRSDPTMTPLLRFGLRWTGIVRGYMDDPESLDCGALLEWTP